MTSKGDDGLLDPPHVVATVRSVVVWHCVKCDTENEIRGEYVPETVTCENCDSVFCVAHVRVP